MKQLRYFSCILAVLFCFALFTAGCAPADAAVNRPTDVPARSAREDIPTSVKIGIVNPSTGALAGFGEGTPWTENLVVDYVNNELGGIYFEEYDATLPIEIIVYDSQSSSTIASEMAQKLVEEDHVDLLLARHTPETVNPVVAVAERYGVPCVSGDEPVDVWLAEGEHEWTYHAHWVMEDLYEMFLDMWAQQGFDRGSGAKVGFLFPTDADSILFRDYSRSHLEDDGYVIVDPGQYPLGTSDYSDTIRTFKAEGVEILLGANQTPDFGAFWLQAKQLGFSPDVVTMAKSFLLNADAESIGTELVNNCCSEVWWSLDRTFTSDLTGMDCQAFSSLYTSETGRPITPPMAVKHMCMQLAVGALQKAGSLDPEDILAGLVSVNTETLMGPIQYGENRTCAIPLTGGQWQLQADGGVKLVIVDNALYPDVPLTGEMRPLN